jgi:hypothetical protein
MVDVADKRGKLIRFLEEALTVADEIEDSCSGYLIECPLDEVRASEFRPARE